MRDLLNRNWNADVFSKHKADIGCSNFVEHDIELEEKAQRRRETDGATQVESVPSENRNVARIRHDRTLKIAMGLRGSNGEKERGAA